MKDAFVRAFHFSEFRWMLSSVFRFGRDGSFFAEPDDIRGRLELEVAAWLRFSIDGQTGNLSPIPEAPLYGSGL